MIENINYIEKFMYSIIMVDSIWMNFDIVFDIFKL